MWTGKCKECGKCCTHENLWLGYNLVTKEAQIEWAKAKGYKIVQLNDSIIQVRIKKTCQHYNGKCKIYDKRPKLCRQFPHTIQNTNLDNNKIIPYGCGYRWEV